MSVGEIKAQLNQAANIVGDAPAEQADSYYGNLEYAATGLTTTAQQMKQQAKAIISSAADVSALALQVQTSAETALEVVLAATDGSGRDEAHTLSARQEILAIGAKRRLEALGRAATTGSELVLAIGRVEDLAAELAAAIQAGGPNDERGELGSAELGRIKQSALEAIENYAAEL